MLPARSKRYASVDGDIPRLVLTSPWQLALIALLVLMLLTVIFPRKALVETLYQQQSLDALTLSYIQNLYRTEPDNADVALLLARSQRGELNIRALEGNLLRLIAQGSLRQRQEARMILFEAYSQGLVKSPDKDKSAALARLIGILQQARTDDLPLTVAQAFAAKAFELNLPELGLDFFGKMGLRQPAFELEKFGDLALGHGQHAVAASYFLWARDSSTSLADARRLFQKGIQTYLAGNLFKEAMLAARQHIGELSVDLPTLRFLSRAAMAAGDPALAAEYARQLVFVPENGNALP